MHVVGNLPPIKDKTQSVEVLSVLNYKKVFSLFISLINNGAAVQLNQNS